MTDDALRLVCEQWFRDVALAPHAWDVELLMRFAKAQRAEERAATWRAAAQGINELPYRYLVENRLDTWRAACKHWCEAQAKEARDE